MSAKLTAATLALAAPQLLVAAQIFLEENPEACTCDAGNEDLGACPWCRLTVALAIAEGRLLPNAPPVPDGAGGYGCCDDEGPHGRCDYADPEHDGEHACVTETGGVHVWGDDSDGVTGCRCGAEPPPVAP